MARGIEPRDSQPALLTSELGAKPRSHRVRDKSLRWLPPASFAIMSCTFHYKFPLVSLALSRGHARTYAPIYRLARSLAERG